jgi:cobalt/nickel transport system permease protein
MTRLAAALDQFRALDSVAARDTALTRRDARAKLLVTLLFLVLVQSCGRWQWAPLLLLAPFALALVLQSGLPARLLARALLLSLPLVLMAAAPDPWLDRTPLALPGGAEIARGWISLGCTALRLVLTLAATLALLAATGLRPLCAALSRLGVPEVLTAQLLFLHRYACVLLEEAARMHTAWQLRAGPGLRQSPRLRLHVWASLAGQWLLRTMARAGRIHQAMLARGFDGRLPLQHRSRWCAADTGFVAAWGGGMVAARWLVA